ncbi:MAG: sortase B protein-sorting domain-containing protein [Paramuribaculum sp.]|nr:sortase B protein-sorting domain-containing protein [Paramuribaculum sp.]
MWIWSSDLYSTLIVASALTLLRR